MSSTDAFISLCDVESGFVLSRQPSVGKWGAATYKLAHAEPASGHRDNRAHPTDGPAAADEEPPAERVDEATQELGVASNEPVPPMPPMPIRRRGSDDVDESGEPWRVRL